MAAALFGIGTGAQGPTASQKGFIRRDTWFDIAEALRIAVVVILFLGIYIVTGEA